MEFEKLLKPAVIFTLLSCLIGFPILFGYEILKLLGEIFLLSIELIKQSFVSKNEPLSRRILAFLIGIAIIYSQLLFPLLIIYFLQKWMKFLTPVFKLYRNLMFFPFIKLLNKIDGQTPLFKNTAEINKDKLLPKIQLQTENRLITIPNPFRGILVVGGAGSGKTESFAIPLIREFSKQNFSGVVYDFKYPTLAQEVEKHYMKSNVSRFYINLSNPLATHRINPLHPNYMPISAYAREFAGAIIKNLMKESIKREDFWSRSATDLLTACIWYLKKEHPNICDLPHVFALIGTPHKNLIKMLSKNTEVRTMIASLATAVESEASGQIAGVVGSLQGAIAQINTPEFMYIFGGNDFSLNLNDKENPSVMVIGSNPSIANTLAPLCSLLVTVATKQMNQPEKEKSFVMLDESPTIFIPNIEVIPNTGRSNKIATVLFVQDLSQLIDGYGKEKSDVLFSSCANHFYGKVSSSQTADILSKQFGKEDKYFQSSSQSRKNTEIFQKNISKSESIQERDVFRNSHFMNLSVGFFIGNIAETNENYIAEKFLMSPEIGKININDIFEKATSKDVSNYYEKVNNDIQLIISGKSLYDGVNKEKQRSLIADEDDAQGDTNETPAEPKDDDFDEIKNILFSEDVKRTENINRENKI